MVSNGNFRKGDIVLCCSPASNSSIEYNYKEFEFTSYELIGGFNALFAIVEEVYEKELKVRLLKRFQPSNLIVTAAKDAFVNYSDGIFDDMIKERELQVKNIKELMTVSMRKEKLNRILK